MKQFVKRSDQAAGENQQACAREAKAIYDSGDSDMAEAILNSGKHEPTQARDRHFAETWSPDLASKPGPRRPRR